MIFNIFNVLLIWALFILCDTDIVYDDRRVCMDAVSSCVEVESQPNQLEFTVYGPHDIGYLAVGIKRSENKDEDSVFVTWFDSSGTPNVMEMIGYNFTNPDIVNETDANIILSESKLMSDRKVIAFTHPLADISHDDLPFQIVNNSLTLTLVYSNEVPRTRGKYKPHFPKYDILSTAHVPLLAAPVIAPVIYSTAVILAHGITMMLGWMVFPALGIYVARYLKKLMDVWWFYLHILFMMFAGVLIVFGMSILAITGPFMWQLSAHGLLGCVVAGLFVFNFFLGILIDRLWDPDRLTVPIQDKIHWWIGRVVPILGMVTIGFGVFKLNSNFNKLPWLISFGILIVLNIILFFINPIYRYISSTVKSIKQRSSIKKEDGDDIDSENGEVETGIQVDYEVEGKKWEHF